jgi:hypothetical protein
MEHNWNSLKAFPLIAELIILKTIMLMDKMFPSGKYFVNYICDVHRNKQIFMCIGS